jgi:hypothetical protein
MKNTKKLIIIFLLALNTACSSKHSMGDFTAISANSVRGLEHEGVRRDHLTKVEAETCYNDVAIIKTYVALITFGLAHSWKGVKYGETDVRIERVVKKALENGKEKGVFDGDVLIDSTIDHTRKGVPFLFVKDCIKAKGYVTASNIRK